MEILTALPITEPGLHRRRRCCRPNLFPSPQKIALSAKKKDYGVLRRCRLRIIRHRVAIYDVMGDTGVVFFFIYGTGVVVSCVTARCRLFSAPVS